MANHAQLHPTLTAADFGRGRSSVQTHQGRWYRVLAFGLLTLAAVRAAGSEPGIVALFSAVSSRTPGAAVLVARNGQIVQEHYCGRANVAAGTPITRDTRFRIGSVRKQFTAAVILKLAENGQLRLEESIARFFPAWPDVHGITLLHLLQHTSGLQDFTSDPGFAGHVLRPVERAELLRHIRQPRANSAPDKSFATAIRATCSWL